MPNREGMDVPASTPLHFDRQGNRLDIDLGAWEARVNGRDIGLSPTQFRLLALLAQHAGAVVSLDLIHTAIWGQWFGSKDNVSVYIHHIRRALGPCAGLLVTRRGAGYMLRALPVSTDGAASAPGSLAFLDDLQQDAARREVAWFVTDRSRLISWVSDTITALTGWPVEAVVGRTPCSFIHESEREAFSALFPLEVAAWKWRMRRSSSGLTAIPSPRGSPGGSSRMPEVPGSWEFARCACSPSLPRDLPHLCSP